MHCSWQKLSTYGQLYPGTRSYSAACQDCQDRITERNGAEEEREERELFAGSAEEREETHARNAGGAEPLENSAFPLCPPSLPPSASARKPRPSWHGCHRRNKSEPEIYTSCVRSLVRPPVPTNLKG